MITETQLEHLAFQWFQDTGWTCGILLPGLLSGELNAIQKAQEVAAA